ncbi:hypothetical protein EW145_g4168 [Phellinidium pouzarii]|uniref:Uncharacterized protein n=1 Tax=Phellinidium pouzarii TaxID=167371 RepID=A0A4S4L4I7_9AGAM|nr:hypothetical protein EW145_g4168 [Phellinidium pouzarii]
MYFKTTTLTIIGLAFIKGSKSQDNVSIALAGFDTDAASGISGEIVGTGTDETTFVLSAAATDNGSLPFTSTLLRLHSSQCKLELNFSSTVTVVQGASQVSEVISLASDVGGVAQCTYDMQGVGACTIVAEDGTATEPETTIVSGTIAMDAVPVTTAPLASSTQATNSGSTSTAQSNSGATSDTSSGAARNLGAAGLGAILPMICAAFIA